MSLRIRRGTDAQRQTVTFDQGELIYTTDTLKLFVGDGVTLGGNSVAKALAGTGLVFDNTTQTLQATAQQGGGIASVSADLNPSLGGNLNLSTHNVTGTGNIGITGTMYASTGLGGNLSLNGNNITGSGNIGITGTISATGLGGDISLNSHNITGVGTVNITGTVTASGLATLGSISTGAITATSIGASAGLSADLPLGGHNINGTGSVNITGAISGTTISAATGLGANLGLNGFNISGSGNILVTGGGGTISNPTITLQSLGTITATGPVVSNYFTNNTLNIGNTTTPNTLTITADRHFGLFTGITNGTNTSGISTRIARGTLASPSAVQAGDFLSFIEGSGFDGTSYSFAGAFGINVDQNSSVTTGSVPGEFGVLLVTSSGGTVSLTFSQTGTLSVPNISSTGLTYYSPNYISVPATGNYTLSSTQTYNILLVTASSLTATINMPGSPVDGQVTQISVVSTTVTLALGSGTVSPTFAGSAAPGTSFKYVYRAQSSSWFRI